MQFVEWALSFHFAWFFTSFNMHLLSSVEIVRQWISSPFFWYGSCGWSCRITNSVAGAISHFIALVTEFDFLPFQSFALVWIAVETHKRRNMIRSYLFLSSPSDTMEILQSISSDLFKRQNQIFAPHILSTCFSKTVFVNNFRMHVFVHFYFSIRHSIYIWIEMMNACMWKMSAV